MSQNLPGCDAEDLDFALKLATEMGQFISAARNSPSFAISYKADSSIVTEIDVAVDRKIRAAILARNSSDRVLSEELAPNFDSTGFFAGRVWIVDPIDGTTNFARGHAHVAVSIALCVDGVTECGVVHAPFLGETFYCQRGSGAFLEGATTGTSGTTPIAPSTRALHESILLTGFSPSSRAASNSTASRVSAALPHIHDIRRYGAAAIDICLVACGRVEGYYEDGIKPWDIAAAGLIARETGCQIGNLTPQESTSNLPAELYTKELLVAAPGVYEGFRGLL